MRYQGVPIKNVMDAIVPITRFNRGEAGKVFEEVSQYGVKVVVKNNVPACVLVKPEQYDAMMDALEDFALYVEAQKRNDVAEETSMSTETLMKQLGISRDEIHEAEVDIE